MLGGAVSGGVIMLSPRIREASSPVACTGVPPYKLYPISEGAAPAHDADSDIEDDEIEYAQALLDLPSLPSCSSLASCDEDDDTIEPPPSYAEATRRAYPPKPIEAGLALLRERNPLLAATVGGAVLKAGEATSAAVSLLRSTRETLRNQNIHIVAEKARVALGSARLRADIVREKAHALNDRLGLSAKMHATAEEFTGICPSLAARRSDSKHAAAKADPASFRLRGLLSVLGPEPAVGRAR